MGYASRLAVLFSDGCKFRLREQTGVKPFSLSPTPQEDTKMAILSCITHGYYFTPPLRVVFATVALVIRSLHTSLQGSLTQGRLSQPPSAVHQRLSVYCAIEI